MNSAPKRDLPPPRLSYRILEGLLWPFMKLARLSCREFARLASERLDRPLTFGEKLRYGFHRILCGVCRPLPKQLEHLRQISHRCGHGHEDETGEVSRMSDEVRQSIREKLMREAGAGHRPHGADE